VTRPYRHGALSHLPADARNSPPRATLTMRWNAVLAGIARVVVSTETIELGERVALRLGRQG
jgi:hypothetical protein